MENLDARFNSINKMLTVHKRKKNKNSSTKSDTVIAEKNAFSLRKLSSSPLRTSLTLFSEETMSRPASLTTVIDLRNENDGKNHEETLLLYQENSHSRTPSSCADEKYSFLAEIAKEIIDEVRKIMTQFQVEMYMLFTRSYMEVGKEFAKLEQSHDKYWEMFFICLYQHISRINDDFVRIPLVRSLSGMQRSISSMRNSKTTLSLQNIRRENDLSKILNCLIEKD